MQPNPKAYLKQYFGYDAFNSGQEEMVTAILSGKDALGVMPTGAGKSICYQLPAIMMEGVTLVVSPLISLMKDQVDALIQNGIPSSYINSSLSAKEINERLTKLKSGGYKIVYIAPERLESERFLQLIQSIHIPLVAVDEAHCVSQWGHDFRPSYMYVSKLLNVIQPRPVCAAFTATATDKVKTDIMTHLKLHHPYVITTGYARENLSFSVVTGVDKRAYLAKYVKQRASDAGIIYAATRKEVEACYTFLVKQGIRAGMYHAGLSEEERSRNQELFLYDDIKVMVATNAFGMGIDKSNVRYVMHYNLPKNIESYYQEAGRAGRDRQESECVLLYASQDIMTQKFLIERSDTALERKTIEYANLNRMVEFCHTTDCLQRYIVQYFGDNSAEPCGKCSNCTDERELVDITEEAMKIFSCIFRMKQRFGMTLTAKVLKGSKDKKIRELGFEQLSTYGCMKGYKEKDITQFIHVLISSGYINISDSAYPTLSLNIKAKPVIEGKEKVLQKIQWREAELQGKADEQPSSRLFEQLRLLRKQFSEQYKVPPFTIFPDATLVEMCTVRPQSLDQMLHIKGIGEYKLERYGQAFLDVILQFEDDEAASLQGQKAASKQAESTVSEDKIPSHEMTLALYNEGLSLSEIARQRGLGEITIQKHLIRCAAEGLGLDWSVLIPSDQEPVIVEAIKAVGSEKLKPIKEMCPDHIEYITISAVIAKHAL